MAAHVLWGYNHNYGHKEPRIIATGSRRYCEQELNHHKAIDETWRLAVLRKGEEPTAMRASCAITYGAQTPSK